MSFCISKEFSFAYAHRVHSQNVVYGKNKCRAIHGHNGVVKVTIYADDLDMSDMVTDFTNLKFIKDFIDTYLDHKWIIDINDPFNSYLLDSKAFKGKCEILDFGMSRFQEDVDVLESVSVTSEVLHGILFVSFNPTSENFCKWLWHVINYKISQMNILDNMTKLIVEFSESPTSNACYTK